LRVARYRFEEKAAGKREEERVRYIVPNADQQMFNP
jgi:hypothetical protein